MTFFAELRRRNVFRVGVAYAVAAWVLLQVFDVVGEILELPAWGGKLILAMLVVGFFIALAVAWAYELTPEGIKRERDVDRSQSITAQTGRKLDRMIIAVLVVAVGYLLLDKLLLQDLRQPAAGVPVAASAENAAVTGSPSIAVLPFVNMSGDADNEYFSDGLTETLLHMLSQLQGLRVAARTSSFAFKGQNTGIAEIAATLGVAHVLEGSVQKADDRVRVTAQLIRADDGFHVWSQNYTRPLQDIFAIQDEIAGDVAAALGQSLLGDGRPVVQSVATRNVSAYDSYLKGLEQLAILSFASLNLAENHFKQALAGDPGFTDARLALARTYMQSWATGALDRETMQERAEPLLQQVREQEPDNAHARAYELVLWFSLSGPQDSAEEVRAKVEALLAELQNVPEETFVRITAAAVLADYFADVPRAVEVLQAGLLVDPLQTELHRWLGRFYIDEGRLDEARASLLRAVELAPDAPNNYGTLGELESKADNLAAYLEWTRRAGEVDPQDHEIAFKIADTLYLLGLVEEGDRWKARVQALAPESAMVRLLDVQRARAQDDIERVITLSGAMVADQVELRQGVFSDALVYYGDAMQRAGRSREGYDFLVEVRPEIADYDTVPPDWRGLLMQWSALDLMSGFADFEARKAAWLRFDAALERHGFPDKYDPTSEYHTWNYVMRGETERAIENFLQYQMSEPVAEWPDLQRQMFPLTLAAVYADPRVAAAMAARRTRYEELRGEVIAMLEQPEWNP